VSALAERVETRRATVSAAPVTLLRAIHDGPIQELFGTALTLDCLAVEHGEDVRGCAETVHRVLTELRAILVSATPTSAPPAAPSPSKLFELVAAAAGGLPVRLEQDVLALAPPPLRAKVASFLTEAVRNARKHADPTYVAVSSTVEGDELKICVENDGVRPASCGPGIGLQLMALDVEQLGGSVSANQVEERWQLMLALPLADQV
jgi:signal transduction histidine kinase